MNILFITDLYPVKSDEKTTPRTLLAFVEEWKKMGHNVDILKPNFILNSFLRGKPFYKSGQYRDVFNTFDKFEAKNHEYWRTRILGLEHEISTLEDILKEVNYWEDKILDEQIRDFELAEEDLREKRENAKYGI